MSTRRSLKLNTTEPATTSSGGWMALAMVLISVVLPQLDSPASAVDLAGLDTQVDVVDRAHLAPDAERRGTVIGAQRL